MGRAVGSYQGTLRLLLHALKYDRRQSLGPALSRLIRQHAADVLHGADCAVPVPLHPLRRWHRGFNQAAALGRELGVPLRNYLRRRRYTSPQAGLTAGERMRNVRDAFRLTRSARPGGEVIVLVDDVSTTGATLESCARVLMDAGAREVRSVTAARVVTRPPA